MKRVKRIIAHNHNNELNIWLVIFQARTIQDIALERPWLWGDSLKMQICIPDRHRKQHFCAHSKTSVNFIQKAPACHFCVVPFLVLFNSTARLSQKCSIPLKHHSGNYQSTRYRVLSGLLMENTH